MIDDCIYSWICSYPSKHNTCLILGESNSGKSKFLEMIKQILRCEQYSQ